MSVRLQASRDGRRLAHYYRAHVIVQMRAAGHSLRTIAGYFLISHQRVAQILKRGPVPAQLGIAFNQEQPS